jgi:hypothetical protein
VATFRGGLAELAELSPWVPLVFSEISIGDVWLRSGEFLKSARSCSWLDFRVSLEPRKRGQPNARNNFRTRHAPTMFFQFRWLSLNRSSIPRNRKVIETNRMYRKIHGLAGAPYRVYWTLHGHFFTSSRRPCWTRRSIGTIRSLTTRKRPGSTGKRSFRLPDSSAAISSANSSSVSRSAFCRAIRSKFAFLLRFQFSHAPGIRNRMRL